MPMSSRGAALCALLLLLGAADVGAFRVGALPLAPRSRFWAPRARATAPRASAVDPKDLPKPVPGFFPLWESNVLQTFGHLFSKVSWWPLNVQCTGVLIFENFCQAHQPRRRQSRRPALLRAGDCRPPQGLPAAAAELLPQVRRHFQGVSDAQGVLDRIGPGSQPAHPRRQRAQVRQGHPRRHSAGDEYVCAHRHAHTYT